MSYFTYSSSSFIAYLTDGTQDFSMMNGTLAGNLTVNGNTTLGNASTDTITLTGVTRIQNGSASIPALAFSTETTFGFYKLSTSIVGLTNNSSSDLQYITFAQDTNSSVYHAIVTAPGSTKDAFIALYESGDGANTGWSIARDDSDSAAFIIGRNNASPGTNTYFRITTAGAVTLGASGGSATHSVTGFLTTVDRMAVMGAADTLTALKIGSSNTLSGTNQIAAYTTMQGTSASTASVRGFNAAVGTAAASFTAGFCANFVGQNGTKGAGSTITNFMNFYSEVPTIGTNNAAFSDSFTFSGNYSLYFSGSYPNLFGGYLQIQNQADPGAVTDGIRIGSVDLSAGNASLSLRTETAVVTETVVSDRTLSVQINGTTYKICLKA